MRTFATVDVFTSDPGMGNPVAVVLDAEGLSSEQMARLAAWTNLSETTFVLPPVDGGDYRVRIFAPGSELPFAGHPTIGTCRALLDAGRITPDATGTVRQECPAGTVRLTVRDGVITFAAPRAELLADPTGRTELAGCLGGVLPREPLLVDAGPRWLTARVEPDELNALVLDPGRSTELFARHGCGITLYALDGEGVEVRSFFSAAGVLTEDPACGSGNVSVGAHLLATGAAEGLPDPLISRQGRHRGRDGRITLGLGNPIKVGGRAITVVQGAIRL